MPGQKAMVIAGSAVQLGLAAAAWTDLARRPAAQARPEMTLGGPVVAVGDRVEWDRAPFLSVPYWLHRDGNQSAPSGLQALGQDFRDSPGHLVAECHVHGTPCPYRSRVEFEGLHRLAATAPKAHMNGGNSHDQPTSAPMPMVSIGTGPCPGTSTSTVTWPD
jgi:hypothetical protein